MLVAELVAHAYLSRVGTLVETTLQGTVGRGHVAVADGFRPLLTQVALIGQVAFYRQDFIVPRSVAEYLQVIDPLIGQVDVAGRTVVVNVGETDLQSVGVGKEAALRVGVRDAHVGVEVVARIAQGHAAVALQSGGVAQPLVLQPDVIGIVLYAVGGHAVVGIVDERHVGAIEETALAPAHLGRQS